MAQEIAAAYLRQVVACEQSGSPLYAEVCRKLATAPALVDVVDGDVGHHPIRVLGALHRLSLLTGIDPWRDPVATVIDHHDEVERLVATQRVQTNEVQRAWALLPAFLSLGAERLDLLELGPSAGLNLVWDRYRYRYAAGAWGDPQAPLELCGDERRPIPATLLGRTVEVVRRRGVDLEPVDATTDDGRLMLRSFVWADQTDRLDRLDRALGALAHDPPQLIPGDYVDLLPSLLDDRIDGSLLVVFQTASTQYLTPERYAVLRETLASVSRPVGWVSTRNHLDPGGKLEGGYELEAGLLPRPPKIVAHMGYHGQWLEWFGEGA
ncbi:MAG: DUF2332 domain-containing protein [Gaiellales bacterium]